MFCGMFKDIYHCFNWFAGISWWKVAPESWWTSEERVAITSCSMASFTSNHPTCLRGWNEAEASLKGGTLHAFFLKRWKNGPWIFIIHKPQPEHPRLAKVPAWLWKTHPSLKPLRDGFMEIHVSWPKMDSKTKKRSKMDGRCRLFYVMLFLIFDSRQMKSYEILKQCKWKDMGIEMNAIVNLELLFNAN